MPESTIVEDEDVRELSKEARLAIKVADHKARKAAHERDEALGHVKSLNKVVGRQGETIHRLRSELARTREEISKVERGQLRWLERQVEILREQIRLDDERADKVRRERDGAIARAERAESLEIAEEGEYQHFDGSWHLFKMDRWRPVQKQAEVSV